MAEAIGVVEAAETILDASPAADLVMTETAVVPDTIMEEVTVTEITDATGVTVTEQVTAVTGSDGHTVAVKEVRTTEAPEPSVADTKLPDAATEASAVEAEAPETGNAV